ncbi:hypothetical protein [Fodinibius sediminis]|uniref:Uncharacterized protein n=1 Tax=Fodinibius sediminis TaxID=1214077 RepID=A0A521CGA5_9BACT|nr:hypothetical protein [Fodinibius sediminis]SMO58473.1 hypothetical protein SAMN06265218_10655 [Fodinibius sediminis]
MKRRRDILFYSVIVIFIATAAVALLGITGVLTINETYLDTLFKALIIELVAAVIGLFVSTNWFGKNRLEAFEEVEGAWWQMIRKPGENAMGFLNISFTKEEQQIKLEGRAFTEQGASWARFWSISAAFNADTDELYYFWQGDEFQSDEDFSGVGFIRFTQSTDSTGKFGSATGWFTRGDLFRAEVTERKKVIYRRAADIEAEAMEDGSAALQQQLVAHVRTHWPSRCSQTSVDELKDELQPDSGEQGKELPA